MCVCVCVGGGGAYLEGGGSIGNVMYYSRGYMPIMELVYCLSHDCLSHDIDCSQRFNHILLVFIY